MFGEGYLLGDSGYGCTPFLLTPYANPSYPVQARFNQAHMSTRCTIERAFSILKQRFQCLRYEMRLQPVKACRYNYLNIIYYIYDDFIIYYFRTAMVCCVLHNIAMERRQDEGDAEMAEIVKAPPLPEIIEEPSNRERCNLRRQGFLKTDLVAAFLRR